MKCPKIAFIWPWVGPYSLNMTKYGPGRGPGGYRYSPPTTHPVPTTPGTPLHYRPVLRLPLSVVPGRVNMVVGLKSVAQLPLSVHFSGLRTMTEVYNL